MKKLSFVAAIVLAVVCLGSMAHAKSAKPEAKKDPVINLPKPTEKKFEKWSLVCQKGADKKELCIVGQEIQGKNDKGEGGRILRLTFSHQLDKDKKEVLALVALLPLGISIPAGAAILVDDGKQIPMKLQRCTGNGCEAFMVVDKKLLASMKKGKTLKVGFNAGVKTLVVPLELKGFSAALAKLP